MFEIWKQIDGYENYEVSDDGKVRKTKIDFIRRGGGWDEVKKISIKKPSENRSGYLTVSLTKNGKTKPFLVHRLVATAFCKNKDPDNKRVVMHLNSVRDDNRAKNLKWGTPLENNRMAAEHKKRRLRI